MPRLQSSAVAYSMLRDDSDIVLFFRKWSLVVRREPEQPSKSCFYHGKLKIILHFYTYIQSDYNQAPRKIELHAPNAHTWLEIVDARWRRTSHLVYDSTCSLDESLFIDPRFDLQFSLATNIIDSALMILGSDCYGFDKNEHCFCALPFRHSVSDRTYLGFFLITLGVAIYVVVGGMRCYATKIHLLADSIPTGTHTSTHGHRPYKITPTKLTHPIIQPFVFTIYATNAKIVSPFVIHHS
jgi:urea-proton symporter